MENVTSSEISNLLNGKFRNAFADNFFIEIDRVSNVTVDFIGIRNYTSSRWVIWRVNKYDEIHLVESERLAALEWTITTQGIKRKVSKVWTTYMYTYVVWPYPNWGGRLGVGTNKRALSLVLSPRPNKDFKLYLNTLSPYFPPSLPQIRSNLRDVCRWMWK